MRILTALFGLTLVVASCTNEPGFNTELPPADSVSALPLENVQHTDVIVQIVPPIVDVLWTVDNSCSMVDEQVALTENFPRFMNYFVNSGLDYHVGVISTDLDQDSHSGKLRAYDGTRYIDENTKDPIDVFRNMAIMGTDGSGIEKGTGAIFTALSILRNDPSNIGFYRQEASIHTIIVSDEDDDTPDFLITHDEFAAWYKALKSGGWRRTFSSIVSPEGEGSFNGGPYLALTAEIGGIPWDIRTEQWDQVLDQLGVTASGLRREFFLSQRPIPSSIQVQVTQEMEGKLITNTHKPVPESGSPTESGQWIYDEARNSIRFVDFTPEPLARIEITYTLLASTVVVTE